MDICVWKVCGLEMNAQSPLENSVCNVEVAARDWTVNSVAHGS